MTAGMMTPIFLPYDLIFYITSSIATRSDDPDYPGQMGHFLSDIRVNR